MSHEVTDFAGRFVKDCDIDIVRYLSEHGRVVQQRKI